MEDVSFERLDEVSKNRGHMIIYRITVGNDYYETKGIREKAVQAMADIIRTDPSKLEPYCDIKNGHGHPAYCKEEPNAKNYVKMEGYYVKVFGGMWAIYALNDLAKIYGVEASILYRIRKR